MKNKHRRTKKPLIMWAVVCFNSKTNYHFIALDVTWQHYAMYVVRKEARDMRNRLVAMMGHRNFRVTRFEEKP